MTFYYHIQIDHYLKYNQDNNSQQPPPMLRSLSLRTSMFIRLRNFVPTFMFSDSPQIKSLPDSSNSNKISENLFNFNTQDQSVLTPKKVVEYLDRFVIGQPQAKKAIAISFRNRWRRKLLPEDLRNQISPKNLLIKGPTGCGKSEIARRLAKLTDSPFLRVEATKYTQVGYVGKDVSSIIQDLVKIGINNYKQKHEKFMKDLGQKVKDEVYLQILDSMLGSEWPDKEVREEKLEKLKAGLYDEHMITVLPGSYVPDLSNLGLEPPYPPQRPITRTVRQAYNVLYSIYYDKLKFLYSNIDITKQALKHVEQEGIIFLDQIDKLATPQGTINTGKGVSTEGVQRDLLPMIQGTMVSTKYGDIKTDHILFIASGSFSMAKVEDLIPQLLGRLPIRVNLNPITLQEFERILTQPQFNLLMQQINLLSMEEINLEFDKEAIKKMAEFAYQMNQNTENIGARRLHAIVEKVMQQISFEAPEKSGQKIVITKEYVGKKLEEMNQKMNLSKYLI